MFFISVQARAYRQVQIAVNNRDDSLDIIQDAMIKLAAKYSDKKDSWGPLFQRILRNCMNDYFRKKKLRSIFSFGRESDEEFDTQSDGHAQDQPTLSEQVQGDAILSSIEKALRSLPERQRQAFILRAWWEYDTSETAFIMQCSEGSVKTHYSRAQKRLRSEMENVNEQK